MESKDYDNDMPGELPDEEKKLLLELKTGAPGAFEKLFKRYWQMILRLCLARLTDPAEAEDVTIETFTDAYRGIKKFRGKCRLSNWLVRIALNRIAQHHRKKKPPIPMVPIENCPENSAQTEPESTPPEIIKLRNCLELLPVCDRNILILYYLNELTLEEIAKTLGKSKNAVAMRLKRAKDRLRRLYLGGKDERTGDQKTV